MSDPDLSQDATLKAKLAALDSDLAAQRRTAGEAKSFPGSRNLDAGGLRASRVGIELMVAILLGVALGYGMDRQFGTSPLFILLGSLLGFAGGVLNAWRALKGTYSKVGFADPASKSE